MSVKQSAPAEAKKARLQYPNTAKLCRFFLRGRKFEY